MICVLELLRFCVPCANEVAKTCKFSTSGRSVDCVIDGNTRLDIFSILFDTPVSGDAVDGGVDTVIVDKVPTYEF